MGNGTITMTGAEYDALASKIATLEAENAKLKGEYEWVASTNTALDESNQSAWAENAKLRAELERLAADIAGWLWHWLMDYCKKNHQPPATRNDLFAVVSDLRKMLTAAPSVPKADDPVKVQLLKVIDEVSRNSSRALGVIGGIRHGENINAGELWRACEYLDAAIAAARKGEGE